MAMSWRDGLLIFERKPLGEVAAEFNRYNQVQLVVAPSATGLIVDGSFRATNVAGFLRLLKQRIGLESVPDGDRKRAVSGKTASGRVDIGGRRIIKNKKT